MAYNYVATAQKSTAVTHAIVMKFTSHFENDLIIAKGNRICVNKIRSNELVPFLETPLFGTISCMKVMKFSGEILDSIFILTERYQYCLLGYDEQAKKFIDKGNGSLVNRIGRPHDHGKLCTIDPEGKMVACYLYEGTVHIIPVDARGHLMPDYIVQIDVFRIKNMTFLYGYEKPVLVVLHSDSNNIEHLRTYVIGPKSLSDGPWKQSNISHDSYELVPVKVPYCGVIVIATASLTYYDGNCIKSCPLQPTKITAIGDFDCERDHFLIGDINGVLRIVVMSINQSKNSIEAIGSEAIGLTTVANCITYIDQSLVFIGSRSGESQLIQLTQTPTETGSFFKIISTFPNIGPIVDMCLVDFEKQGQSHVVTCSGCYKDGSIRIIRNGIGIQEQASIDLEGIKGVFSLKSSADSEYDKYLVQSFFNETRILAIDGSDMEEIEIESFLVGQTLFCGNTKGDTIVQVTKSGVVLLDSRTLSLLFHWTSDETDETILLATGNKDMIVIGCNGGMVYHFEIDDMEKALSMKGWVKMDHEISCLAVNPHENTLSHIASAVKDDGKKAKNCSPIPSQLDHLIAVGLWKDMSIRILNAKKSLKEMLSLKVKGETQARSLLFVTLAHSHKLFVGLGDGNLITYDIIVEKSEPRVKNNFPRRVTLGTRPIELSCLFSKNCLCIFVTGDRPTILFGRGNKVQYTSANVTEIHSVCSFSTEDYPDCLALSDAGSLTIGTVDDIEKLHIQTIELKQQPKKIVHHEPSRIFGLLTSESIFGSDEVENVRFLDDSTFEEIYRQQLKKNEKGLSICVSNLSGMDEYGLFIIVGASIIVSEDYEPKEGRIMAFSIQGEGKGRKVSLVAEVPTEGAVYNICPFMGDIVAAINCSIIKYRFKKVEEYEKALYFEEETSFEGFTIALYMKTMKNFVLVGDLMRSVTLLEYVEEKGQFSEVGKDYGANWMSSVEFIDEKFLLGSENESNLFVLKRNCESLSEEVRFRLDVCGQFHLGDFVNSFVKGSLVMEPVNAETAVKSCGVTGQSVIYGTSSGAIGSIVPITKEAYEYYIRLQRNLLRVIKPLGGLSHQEWRAFCNDRFIAESLNFIDGDIIESFVDMNQKEQERVLRYMTDELAGESIPLPKESMGRNELEKVEEKGWLHLETTVEEIENRILDMMRMH